MNLEQCDGGIGMSELKPCSKCGSTRVEMVPVRPWLSLREQQDWEPFCNDCYVAGYLGSEQARIDAWNRRPIEDELRATIRKMDQSHTQSLQSKLVVVGKLAELEALRKKLKIAVGALESVSEILGGPRSENVTLFEYSKMIEDALAKIKGD